MAAASAWYTRQQAHQAKRVAAIESDRRTDELAAQRDADLARKQARLRLYVECEPNLDGSIGEGPFRHALVVTNEGPADARDVEVEIASAWENPMGTRACFAASGRRRQRVGRLPALSREVLALKDDPTLDFGDVGECELWWGDDTTPDLQTRRLPARPNWL